MMRTRKNGNISFEKLVLTILRRINELEDVVSDLKTLYKNGQKSYCMKEKIMFTSATLELNRQLKAEIDSENIYPSEV